MLEGNLSVLEPPLEDNANRPTKNQKVLSITAKLVPSYPQFPLERGFEQYQGARFLLYNSIGCVIQRFEDDRSSILQLELHDKSKPKKFKIDSRNRSYGMFSLKEKALLCATTNLIIFQEQRQLKAGCEGWEMSWSNVQGVTIGSNWVAVINNEEIRILDYGGNELHCICFDRRFVTMQAYEDLLAVVYHSSIPMWGCQSLKMRIYKITTFAVTVDRDVVVPMRPNSILKWFGFSEEGMIFCQDTLEVLRSYSFNRNEWRTVFSLEGKQECLFLQHIQGTDIYGFQLKHQAGEREEPKVLPRTLPRKIAMEGDIKIDFFSKDETNYIQKMMLKNVMIEHEQYRHEMWFKLKYSRKKDDPWFQHSKSIKSEEEIKTVKMQIDLQLHDYLKKFLARTQTEGEKLSRMMTSLMLICEREAHYEQTKEKLREMLISKKRGGLPSYFEELVYRPTLPIQGRQGKMNEITILEQMMNLMGEG